MSIKGFDNGDAAPALPHLYVVAVHHLLRAAYGSIVVPQIQNDGGMVYVVYVVVAVELIEAVRGHARTKGLLWCRGSCGELSARLGIVPQPREVER